jgi:molecular chaperone DnaJ
MTTRRDYYEILGVSRTADGHEIKRAYRKLAVTYHPDRNPDDPEAPEKFREATEAYTVLKDSAKRAQYDRFGHAGVADQFGGGFGAGGFDIDLNEALASFLNNFGGLGDLFGGVNERGGVRGRGRNLQLGLELTLAEAATGVKKRLEVRKQVVCRACDGSGAARGSGPTACGQCRGHGRVRQVRQTLLGQMVAETACPACGGRGSVVEDPCGDCRGSGTVRGSDTIEVKFPAGVTTGNYLELAGQGDAGAHGGPSGDLRVVVSVRDDELFERHGDDILLDVPVSPVDLMLGIKLEVPTLDGKVALKIPAGTQSHKIFRLRGKGISRLNRRGKGDQLVRVLAWTPQRLSSEHKRRLQELRADLGETVPEPGRHVFD